MEEPVWINVFTTTRDPGKSTTGINVPPLRAPAIDILPNARWQHNGTTVGGGNSQGTGPNQLFDPSGIYVDDDQTIYVADRANNRIVKWKLDAKSGQVVAGGNGRGNETSQLWYPSDVIVDKERDSLIICDHANERVVRWPLRNGTSGETIISKIPCWGLTMDENGSLYVTDRNTHAVKRYRRGESKGTVIAGGNGRGNHFNQLNDPRYVFIDQDHSVYVSDFLNHRVMKWDEGAKQGIVVAGGKGTGNSLTQLFFPEGLVVDRLGTVYVVDQSNNRIMRWMKGAPQGNVIVGENGPGKQLDQLRWPVGLSFDRYGNLYVVDWKNHRIQKFKIEVPPLRAPAIDIHSNARWQHNGITVAGGNSQGNERNQLFYPSGIYVDDDQTIYVADRANNR
ncbi:unnamed protein product, partial [Rotaria sp. Silwood1]